MFAGWFRVLLFYASLVVVAYFLVFAADVLTLLSYKTFGEFATKRLDDSIVRIQDERPSRDEIVRHPVTLGRKEPRVLHKMSRYPMEDVQMTCSSFNVLWFSGKPLKQDHVTWRLNGVPLQFTDRHTLDIESSEFSFITWPYRENIKEYGASVYEVRATLTIHLLSESDFGSYTCHIKNTRFPILQYINYMDHLNRTKFEASGQDAKGDTEEKRRNAERMPPSQGKSKHKRPICQCEQVPIIRYVPQDTVTWTEEYRVIPLERTQQKLILPPATILSFTSNYVMSKKKDDTEVEYLVNDNDFFELCPGQHHGCSLILLYYWQYGSELNPPFRRWQLLEDFQAWKEESEHVHCLCENSYGIHSVRYLRRYFNRTKGQFELIEITHPNTLAIIPREQTMLAQNFVPRCKYDAELASKQSAEETMSYFESVIANMKIRTELAIAMVKLFHWNELFFLFAVSVLCAVSLLLIKSFLGRLCNFIRQCTLHGFLAYFITAVFSKHEVLENNIKYDVFMSSSDEKRDVNIVREILTPRLEGFGYRVCVPDRDLLAGEQELSALDTAIENSKRFIIFLSHDYAQDRFLPDFVNNMILGVAVAKPAESRQILIVRLDTCEVPLNFRHFPVHDWSGNVTDEDHVLWIRRWLESAKQAALLRGPIDAFVTLLPLGLSFSFFTAYKIYSFLN